MRFIICSSDELNSIMSAHGAKWPKSRFVCTGCCNWHGDQPGSIHLWRSRAQHCFIVAGRDSLHWWRHAVIMASSDRGPPSGHAGGRLVDNGLKAYRCPSVR